MMILRFSWMPPTARCQLGTLEVPLGPLRTEATPFG